MSVEDDAELDRLIKIVALARNISVEELSEWAYSDPWKAKQQLAEELDQITNAIGEGAAIEEAIERKQLEYEQSVAIWNEPFLKRNIKFFRQLLPYWCGFAICGIIVYFCGYPIDMLLVAGVMATINILTLITCEIIFFICRTKYETNKP